MKEEQGALKIKLLGGFHVEYNGKVLSNIFPRALNLRKLFCYLVANHGKFIPAENIIDVLWPEDEDGNLQKALQNLVYRLRKMLAEANSGEEYILFSHNSYSWNTEAKCQVDAFLFESIITSLKAGKLQEEEAKAACKKALSLYRGDFLEDLSMSDWVEPFAAYYRRLNFDCIDIYLDLLADKKELDTIIEVCAHAIQQNVFDEHYHACLIRAMLAKGNRYGALSHYESITSLLMKELGVEPSEELLSAVKGIYSGNDTDIQYSLDTILSTLTDINNTSTGPLYCDIDIFRQIFKLYERNTVRSHEPCYLLMFTVSEKNPQITNGAVSFAVTEFKRACIVTLRKMDVLCQHSATQVLLLLSRADKNSIEKIIDRIMKQFSLFYKKRDVEIKTQMRSLHSK